MIRRLSTGRLPSKLAGVAPGLTLVIALLFAQSAAAESKEQGCAPAGETEAAPAEPEAPPAGDPGPAEEPGEPGEPGPEAPSEPPPEEAPIYQVPGTAPPDQEPESLAETLGRQPSRVKCLDESLIDEFGRARVRKGVQPRRFRKRLRVSLSLMGGVTGGDLLDTSWQGGGALAFWLSEDFGFDAQFRISRFTLRIERSASGFTGEDRFGDDLVQSLAYSARAHLLWSPIHTKLRAREDRIIHGDFVFFAGGGRTFHDTVQGIAFDIGASFYLYPLRWLSIRIDLSDDILTQEVFGSRRISNNLVFSTGVAIWFPFRR